MSCYYARKETFITTFLIESIKLYGTQTGIGLVMIESPQFFSPFRVI